MINVVYLVVFMIGANGVTSQNIPQANMKQCQANAVIFNTESLLHSRCEMKVRIKTFNGELPEYLTLDRVYEVNPRSENTFILDDGESLWMCLFENCPNLNGGSWGIVND